MTEQTIKVEGLPEGWKAVTYSCPKNNENFFFEGEIITAASDYSTEFLVVEKIQPSRIVLEMNEKEFSLLLKIPIEQRLLRLDGMLDLIDKIQSLNKKSRRMDKEE